MDGRTLVIGVMGLGSVGEGIAQALLAGPTDVELIAVDQNPELLRAVRRRLKGLALEGAGITVSSELTDLKRADLVVESVSQEPHVKETVLRQLDSVCPPDTVIATVSAVLPVDGLAEVSGRPDRVLGVRAHLPLPHGRSVELKATGGTSPEALLLARRVFEAAGCTVVSPRDDAGEAVTELVYGYLNQAAAMVELGYATEEDVDAAMRFGCGLPYGPLQLLDILGLDTVSETLRTLHGRKGDAALAPVPLLDSMVEQGRLGRKSGRGFHRYTEQGDVASAARDAGVPGSVHRIARIGVVGSGTMARGIAEVAARSGISVVLVARSERKAGAAFDAVDRSLARAEQRGRISECERLQALGWVCATDDYAELADCDVLIEAVAEELSVKCAVLGAMDAVAKPGAVLATITSSLSVTQCAHATSRPSEVIGLHFFNPAPVMKLVEIVCTDETSPGVRATAHTLARLLGKKPVDCTDRAGFIVNALLFPFLNRAIGMLDRPGLDVETIDAAVTTGFGHPMGPFTLLDTVGLDVSLAILRALHAAAPDTGPLPAAALEMLVAQGRLGRKTGGGFRVPADGRAPTSAPPAAATA